MLHGPLRRRQYSSGGLFGHTGFDEALVEGLSLGAPAVAGCQLIVVEDCGALDAERAQEERCDERQIASIVGSLPTAQHFALAGCAALIACGDVDRFDL